MNINILKKFFLFIKNNLNIIMLLLAILIVAYTIFFEFNSILLISKNIKFIFLFYSFTSIFSGILLAAYAWHKIQNKFGKKFTFKLNLYIYIYSMLGTILPGSIFGIVNRVAQYSKLDERNLSTIFCSGFEAIIISFGSLFVFSLSLIFVDINPYIDKIYLSIFLFVFFILVATNPKIINKISTFILKRQKQTVLLNTNYSFRDIVFWLAIESIVAFLAGLGIFLLLNAFFTVSIEVFPLIISAVALTNAISSFLVWVPGTLFLRDGFFLVVLTSLLSNSEALFFTVIQRVWLSLIILFNVFLLFFFNKIFINNPKLMDK